MRAFCSHPSIYVWFQSWNDLFIFILTESCAANIFVGNTEAPLLIKPYLSQLTKSELHSVMTGGFATIAGGVMAAYIAFGIPAEHLLSASVMSAPAALAVSKLFYLETEKPQTKGKIEIMSQSNYVNGLSAKKS